MVNFCIHIFFFFGLTLLTYFLPLQGVKASAEAKIGMERLRRFLLIEDQRDPIETTKDQDNAVELENVVAVWPAVTLAGKAFNNGPGKKNTTIKKSFKKQKQQPSPQHSEVQKYGEEASNGGKIPTSNPALNHVNFTVKNGERLGKEV